MLVELLYGAAALGPALPRTRELKEKNAALVEPLVAAAPLLPSLPRSRQPREGELRESVALDEPLSGAAAVTAVAHRCEHSG